MVKAKTVVKEPKTLKVERIQAEVTPNEKEKEVKEKTADVLMRPCGCCKKTLDALAPGQKYFEAPDGHVILGEEKVSQVWDRRGKGSWINPAR